MAGMMNSPEFFRSMSEMMARPEVIDQVGFVSYLPASGRRLPLIRDRPAASIRDCVARARCLSYTTGPRSHRKNLCHDCSLIADHRCQSPTRIHGSSNQTNDEQPDGQANDVEP